MAISPTVISIVGKFTDQATPGIDKLSNKLGGMSSAFGRIGSVLAGISFVALANQALQAAEALQNAAIQTGISTDALQRLQFAAGLSGTSLETVAGAITKMQRALVTSGEGSEQAVKTLDRLGIATSDLLALQPDKQFERIAVAITAIKDPAERATAAVGLFGRGGAALLPTLTAIGENTAVINQQFMELGGTVSDQAIAGVDQLGDSIDTLKVATGNLGIEILALLSGPLTALSNNLRQNIGELRALGGSGGEMENLGRRMRALQDARTGSVGSTMVGEFGGGYALQGMFTRTENGVIAVRRQIAALDQEAQVAAFRLQEFAVEIPEPQIPDLKAIDEARAASAKAAADAQKQFRSDVFSETATSAEKALESLVRKTDLLRQAREQGVISAEVEVKRYSEIIRAYNDAITAGLEEVTMKGAEKITAMNAPINEMAAMQERAAQSVQDAFVSAFSNIDQGLGGMVKGFLKAFAQILAQAAALDLAKALNIGQIFGGSGAGGGSSSTGSFVGNLIKGFFGRSGGGLVSGAAVVGEDGPELLLSGGTSMVMNKRQLAFNSGGGGMAYSPTTNIIVQGDVNRESEARLLAYIEITRSKDQREMMRVLERNGMRNIR